MISETFFSILLLLVIAWSTFWMGFASWKAARNNQMVWFIVFLVVHTLGILEILYILFFQKNQNKKETKTAKKLQK